MNVDELYSYAMSTTVLTAHCTTLCRYLRDGMATNKSDVYAFGVVLFEMISGKEAITRADSLGAKSADRRSLASIVSVTLSFESQK